MRFRDILCHISNILISLYCVMPRGKPTGNSYRLKEPAGKKHYTAAEFRAERGKMMKEMEQNNGGNRRVIRMN